MAAARAAAQSPVIGGFLAVWVAFSVLRNLPWAPFTAFYV